MKDWTMSSSTEPCSTAKVVALSLDSQHDAAAVEVSHQRLPFLPMASSKAETILISSSGDVLTCRCRNSPYPTKKEVQPRPYKWTDEVAVMCCDATGDDEIGHSICSLWNGSSTVSKEKTHRFNRNGGGGLLGGAPAEVAGPLHHFRDELQHGRGASPLLFSSRSPSPMMQHSSHSAPVDAFRGTPLVRANHDDDDEGIVPILSFDYSQTYDGGFDSVPQSASVGGNGAHLDSSGKENEPHFLHGIPTFSSFFSNVKIRKVSAHPLGAHVLLISQAGLLYSYGLNTHGQLGIGVLSDARGIDQGYIMTPTIVTPLVENGGKAVQCAAGVSHSLVVVETEEQRLVKTRSFDQSKDRSLASHRSQSQSDMRHLYNEKTESVVHHQMYGFGRNSFMKIGLVSPKMTKRGTRPSSRAQSVDEMECVILPRRVALRCSVQRRHRHRECKSKVPMGIFAVDASVDHSAALVHRSSGDVELYTWGSAMCGALGLPHPAQQPTMDDLTQSSLKSTASTVRVVPVPSFVASLSKTSNVDAQASSLLLNDLGEHPVDISLGRNCSFVVTSIGRCFSFGTSDEGMLGLGRGVSECHQPTEIQMPDGVARQDKITSVSAGAAHVVACTSTGNAYAWGVRSHVGLDVPGARHGMVTPSSRTPSHARKPPVGQVPLAKDNLLRIEWSPKQVKIPIAPSNLYSDTDVQFMPIMQACAGNDCSFFISESGKVFSTGKNSGRLGRGELEEEIVQPRPLFGGLHLFKNQGDCFT